mgnify:CR=1 FL=1
MKIDYKHWFKCETWTLEQAAYLCYDIDPNDVNTIDSLNSFVKRNQYVNPYKTVSTPIVLTSIKKTIQVLETINWEGNNNRIPVNQLIDIIEEKELNESKKILEEWGAYIKKYGIPSSQTPKESANNNFPFSELNSLKYNEITITFLDGDTIELSAREIIRTFTYEMLGLRDMRKKGDIALNSAGHFLAEFLSTCPPKPDEKKSKHKDTLKKLINSWFCLSGDPFTVIGSSPTSKYEPRFTLKNESDRASKRAEKRAKHESFNQNIEGNYFDDEEDAAGEFLKKNQ